MSWQAVEGSFRDPSGFVYTRDGTLLRQVNAGFRQTFEAFLASGLCDELVREGLLVAHERVGLEYSATPDAYAVLRPERLPFISYPYEWSFGQLQDAAVLTLEIQERALRTGFTLRDSSAYNIQFQGGRPVFIDTLSFEPWEEGKPWAAYKQFCEHFLLPLTLMSSTDIRCGTLLRSYVDGIPLDLGSRLLPHRSWASLSAVLHIHLHAWAQGRYAGSAVTSAAKGRSMSQRSLLTLVKNLSTATQRLSWRPSGTEWADYTTDNNYSDAASRSKREMVLAHLAAAKPKTVWDLGANTGEYSRAAREVAGYVVSFDVDPAAVERNYRRVRSENENGILPLLLDLTNPVQPIPGPDGKDGPSKNGARPMPFWRWRWCITWQSETICRSSGLLRISAGWGAIWSSSSCPKAILRCLACCSVVQTSFPVTPKRDSKRPSSDITRYSPWHESLTRSVGFML